MYDTLSNFMHCPNPDDSYTSICSRCFATAGSGKASELELAERAHVCRQGAPRLAPTLRDRASPSPER
jgi:hypothetical protein